MHFSTRSFHCFVPAASCMEENGYEAAPDQIASEHLEKSELDQLLSWIQTYGDSESDERNAPRGGLDSEAADVVPDDNIDIKDDFIVEDDEESLRTAKWNVKMTLRSHLDSIRAMQFHPVEPVLITAGEDGTAKLWNLDGTKEKSGGTTEIEPVYTFRGHLGPGRRFSRKSSFANQTVALLEDVPVLSRTTLNSLHDSFVDMTRSDMKTWLEKTHTWKNPKGFKWL
ncbi:unnamed protein product [Cylicocyclus nassatus]|uniref:Uncharacterized protein n=1 Tax=Cylicocyclus nassatus TaxID=53992 RepID=A0AA36M8Y8_CYLNA|nr:unnamed protein product [Cylicocyclus nassatus]